jgi:hypothetical protein
LALNAFLATYLAAFSSSHAYLEACGADVDIFNAILQAGPFNASGTFLLDIFLFVTLVLRTFYLF